MTARLSNFAALDGTMVLEVGAGTGRDALELARRGARSVALDYSLESLRLVKSQLSKSDDVSVVCADALSLPFKDGVFDIVFHQGLLEHFRDPGRLLSENARVLKEGGLILVDVPQRYHYYTIVKKILIALDRWFAGWEREFSIGELERLIEEHGFSVISSYGEWFNPPIWYRMLRRSLKRAGISLPMYPRFFAVLGRIFAPIERRLLTSRASLYTTVVIGVVAKKK